MKPVFIFLLLFVISCAALTVGQYDSILDTGISAVQTTSDYYYGRRADGSTVYSKPFYDSVRANIQSLVTRAQSIPRDTGTVKILGHIQSIINTGDSIEREAGSHGSNPSKAFFTILISTIDQNCGEAIAFELAKKPRQP